MVGESNDINGHLAYKYNYVSASKTCIQPTSAVFLRSLQPKMTVLDLSNGLQICHANYINFQN